MNIYSDMKYKYKEKYLETAYLMQNVNANSSMFIHDIEGMDKENEIPIGTIEKILITNGCCGITKVNDKFVVGVASYLSNGTYGIGTDVKITTFGEIDGDKGLVLDRKIGVDCVIIFNNNTHSPDLDLCVYANTLCEIDKSLDALIKNSRIHPIPIAKNREQKAQISKAIEDNDKGITSTILSENVLSDLMGEDKGINILNITDVNASDKLQYLSLYYNDILRRFYTKYGHVMQNNGKLAQQTRDEVNDMSLISFIEPLTKLANRQQGYDCLNKLYGTTFNCAFSETWALEYEKLKASIKSDEESEQDGKLEKLAFNENKMEREGVEND